MSVISDHRPSRTASDCAIDEASVVKLVYRMRQQPDKERNIILASVRPQLQTALYRVIKIIEKTLQAKGIFQHSVSLLTQHRAIVDLLAKRTDISTLWEYLIGFYQTTIDKIADHLTIHFYSQLVALLEGNHTTAPEKTSASQPKRAQLPVIKEVREERPAEEEAALVPSESNEVEIVEEACVASKQISAVSLEFLESFTGGTASGKELKGKVLKRCKVGCLQPGEPMQKWQYYDSLDRGIVKVVFTSRK